MREIKFRYWNTTNDMMVNDPVVPTMKKEEWSLEQYFSDRGWVWMQYTGLKDKNGVAEIYEGDIIDSEGLIIGNIYESSQIYKEGVNYIVAEMGTKAWRNSESIAMGLGCNYAE